MRNVFLKAFVCLFLMALFPIQGLTAGRITAEGINGLITPLGNDAAIVMDKEDGILDIYWIEGNRIKNEVHMPYDEYNWNVVPTEKGWPELVLHVNDSWTWAMWLDGGIYQFRELATYPTIVKPEGLFFSHLDFLNETYEFMNMDGETILHGFSANSLEILGDKMIVCGEERPYENVLMAVTGTGQIVCRESLSSSYTMGRFLIALDENTVACAQPISGERQNGEMYNWDVQLSIIDVVQLN